MKGTEWLDADPYLARHLAAHAAKGGVLDRLVTDAGYLSVAEPSRLVPALSSLSETTGLRIASVYQRIANLLVDSSPVERMALVHLMALKEEPDLAVNLEPLLVPDWRGVWARWRRTVPSTVLASLSAAPSAAAIATDPDAGPVLIAALKDELRSWSLGTVAEAEAVGSTHSIATSIAVASRADGAMVVTGFKDGAMQVFGLPGLQSVAERTKAHEGAVQDLVVIDGPDGPLVTSCGEDGAIAVWRLPELDLVIRRRNTAVRTLSLAIASHKREAVLISGGDAYGADPPMAPVNVWSLPALKPISTFEAPTAMIERLWLVGFRDGSVILGSRGSGHLWCWDLETGRLLTERTGKAIGAQSFHLLDATDSSAELIVTSYGQFRMLQLKRSANDFTIHASPWIETAWGIWRGPVTLWGRSHFVSLGREIRLWDLTELRSAIRSTPASDAEMRRLQRTYGLRSVVAVGSGVWSGSDLGTLHCWAGLDGREVFPPYEGSNPVVALVTTVIDGRAAVVAGQEDGVIRIFDAETGETRLKEIRAGVKLSGLAIGQLDADVLLATVGADQPLGSVRHYEIRLWRLPAGEEIDTTNVRERPDLKEERRVRLSPEERSGLSLSGWKDKELNAVAFAPSPRGLLLIAGGHAPIVRAWSAETFDPVLDLDIPDFGSHITSLAPYPTHGGFGIAAGTADGFLIGWDLREGTLLHRAQTASRAMRVALISWRGRLALATGGEDGNLRVWDLETWDPQLIIPIGESVWGVAQLPNGDLAVATLRGMVTLSSGKAIEHQKANIAHSVASE